MNYILCSEGFRKFFSAIQVNVSEVTEALDLISRNLSLILDEISLGKLVVSMDAPASVYEPDGKKGSREVYCSSDGYEEQQAYQVSFSTGENGTCDVIAYPKKGCSWNQEEENALSFLAQNIFVFCGRARMIGLMQRANVLDNLTGVYNLNGLMRHGQIMLAKGSLSDYVACYCNIKNFKYVNQQVGSRYGDQILKKYSQGITKWQLKDEFLARLGGDNFFALIRKERIESFLSFISSFRVRIKLPDSEKEYAILSRVGICEMEPGDSVSDALDRVTVAIDVARRYSEQDTVWYCAKMSEETMHEKEVSLMFPKALKEREFVVYYQPKVDLQTNQICGSEALVRWMRDGKMVSPLEFIQVLEKEGSICNLDFYVFEQVCRDMREWLDAGLEPVRVSVNFSKVHLRNAKLTEKILEIMARYQLDSKYIEVELTEMSGFSDYDALTRFIDVMKKHGVNTSIDDFGSGYSSLNLLKNLRVDIIKLDKSFLDDIMHNRGEEDEIVIKNIVRMVRELNMEIVAEGVETKEQAEFLKKVQCGMAQGYLFDRPLPKDEYEKRLSSRMYSI